MFVTGDTPMRLLRICLFGVAIGITASIAAHGEEPKPAPWRHIDQSQYVGAVKCSECHLSHYDGWKDTAHNKMIRVPVAEGPNKNILADFAIASEHRQFELKDVKWVVGSRWKQRFIGDVDGKEVVYPAQWSVKDKKWQAYEGKTDWWYPTHKDWKERSNFKLCAGCHSTGSDAYSEKWTELNISCESCHGPGKEHSAKPKIENIVNPARLSTARSMDVCLACHQSGKPPGDDYAWPVGYQPGLKLKDFWQPFVLEQGKPSTELWPNGAAHKNRVQGNTFEKSVMHASGLQCTNCHDAHGSRFQSMTIKSVESNALCLTCHGPGKDQGPNYQNISEHTHHDALSTGSHCIECHMPKTGANSVSGEARNHTFDFVSPAQTLANKSPNSCNGCHADKTPDWALTEVKKWYPKLK